MALHASRRRIIVSSGRWTLLLLLCASLAACATSSASFITKRNQAGYSATRGRFTQITGLSTSKIEPLSDGVALTVGPPGCEVSMDFEGEQSDVFELEGGTILVCASDEDCILNLELKQKE